MRVVKRIDLSAATKILFEDQVVKGNDYLTGRMTKFIETTSYDRNLVKMLDGQALKKALLEISTELETFTRELFHEQIIQEEASSPSTPAADESQFITSLSEKKRTRMVREKELEPQPTMTLASGNRKGQRARRAEWEKLYGRQAKHLQQQQQQRHEGHYRSQQQQPQQQRQQHRLQQHELHPSWEAQRRQREILKEATTKGSVTNQRIKFVDDDE